MTRKNETPDPKHLFDDLLTGPVKGSAQQVWLAGLAALAKAQQEGGRVFEALVKEGAALQKQNPSTVGAQIAEVAARMSGLAKEAGQGAPQPWDRLEAIFDERVSKALARLGVPTAADVKALEDRIGDLTARLEARADVPGRVAARPAAAGKAPVKRAVAKKST